MAAARECDHSPLSSRTDGLIHSLATITVMLMYSLGETRIYVRREADAHRTRALDSSGSTENTWQLPYARCSRVTSEILQPT